MRRILTALTVVFLFSMMACGPSPVHTPTSSTSTISMPPPTGQADPDPTPEPEHRIYLPSILKGYTPHLEISCVNGPVQNYVNQDVVFEVTSGGEPVEGATVCFAGYERQTDEDGRAIFNIDMAGPFKARVEKPGYEDASTLLWVFPEGNEKFPIRAIRLHSEQVGTTIADYRMAGANCASIKVYYLYDEEGNIYPASPFPSGWTRIPRDVHQKFYEWQISEARRWGFEKIYLIAQPLEESIFASESPHSTVLSEEAKQNYLEQNQKEAIRLGEFAEEQNVDILDAFNPEVAFKENLFKTDADELSSEDILLYQKLLPELRERFSGDLAGKTAVGVQYFVKGQKLPKHDYSGFDYVTPPFSGLHGVLNTGSPSEWENAIHKYFEYTEQLRKKYGVKLMPVYVPGLQIHNEQLFNQFLRNGKFEDYEDVKVWLLNSILDEASKRNVDGAETYTLWYHSRRVEPHGPYGYKFPVWQSKRPLDTVANHFSHPWNKEGRETLRVLQHAALLTNSIASHNQELAGWLEDKIAEGLKAYNNGDYTLASSIANEILKKASGVNNPLGIVIDGNGKEWVNLDPIYYNASEQLPPLELLAGDSVPLGENEALITKNLKSLKAVYAINDPEYLYLMLEFYGPPPTHGLKHGDGPFISIDTSGEWTHQEGKEYQVALDRRTSTLWSQDYNREWTGHLLYDLREVAYGDVVEVKIPLKYIGNPKKVNLLVWYPTMAEWGGMEVDIVKWCENTR